ncbi:CBS domain-containing protein [Streptomyces smyrnaeus]|uniref:CBS domain-containing protein n=1 Tax=Streptomyces TaxID=1883 RepID=UPI000C1744DB|nr:MULTISPECIES: CBS domain-containing protein [unclassified Streptomyces]MBQ0867127.1 CBS domain-containing protein [Streptomyces sp. RK75]MBQ1121166.1 CBS domain-containing protein [Streptomyces sp. B15]MBQ1161409.1 CBS domain-containing protein [Streptomyces sp. A73]
MTTAADIMHPGARWVPATETLDRAAQLMRELDVGALPVSDPNDPNERMCGIITDRDIVVGCVAAGRDPSRVTAGDLCEGTPRWVSADADLNEVLREMETHQIRRLPVIDENKRLVGVISETDLAHHLSDDQLAEFVEQVYA